MAMCSSAAGADDAGPAAAAPGTPGRPPEGLAPGRQPLG